MGMRRYRYRCGGHSQGGATAACTCTQRVVRAGCIRGLLMLGRYVCIFVCREGVCVGEGEAHMCLCVGEG